MFKNLNKKGGVFKTSSANAKRNQHIAYQNYLIKKQIEYMNSYRNNSIATNRRKINTAKINEIDYSKISNLKRNNYIDEFNVANKFLQDPKNYSSIQRYNGNLQFGPQLAKIVQNDTKFTKKDLTIVLAIKNRSKRFKIFIEYYNKFCSDIKLIIVEAKGNDMLDRKLLGNNTEYIPTDIGEKWCLSKLRNMGIQHCNTKFIIFSDVDFIYNNLFSKHIETILNSKDVINSFIGLPIFESWYTFDHIKKKVNRNIYDEYGAMHLCESEMLKKHKFNENIKGFGGEERELQRRLKGKGIRTKFIKYPNIPIYTLHYSHDMKTRVY